MLQRSSRLHSFKYKPTCIRCFLFYTSVCHTRNRDRRLQTISTAWQTLLIIPLTDDATKMELVAEAPKHRRGSTRPQDDKDLPHPCNLPCLLNRLLNYRILRYLRHTSALHWDITAPLTIRFGGCFALLDLHASLGTARHASPTIWCEATVGKRSLIDLAR